MKTQNGVDTTFTPSCLHHKMRTQRFEAEASGCKEEGFYAGIDNMGKGRRSTSS